MGARDIRRKILCECGNFVDFCTFKAYIKTPINPSTPTIGHRECGLIFDFFDKKMFKRYSSKKELKIIALKFASKRLEADLHGIFLLEIDRLKSNGKMTDVEILIKAFEKISKI